MGFTISKIGQRPLTDVLLDTSIFEKHFCSCLTDDLETFTSTLEEIKTQDPSLSLVQPSAVLAAYEQQPRVLMYCLSHGASLEQSVQKAIKTPINPSIVPIRSTQPRAWSIPFLDALYELDWDNIRSSRKALGRWLQESFSPEVLAWFFDHGAEVTPDFFEHMSHFPVPAVTVQDFLERSSIASFKYSGVLQRAAGRSETDVVKLLLDAGADINAGPFGGDEREPRSGPAIKEAVKRRHVETAKLLLERGADTQALYHITYSEEPRTIAGRQDCDMAALLRMYGRMNGHPSPN